MSFNGGYVPTGANGVLDSDGREQKRRKMSPTPGAGGFKQPQVPNRQQQEEAKTTDINDLSDLMTSSGVDLKGEEDFLTSSFQRRQAIQTQTRQAQQSPYAPNQSHTQPTNFDLLAQNQRFPSIGQHHGTLNQPAAPQQSQEQELEQKHRRAARQLAETQQHHLNAPFLLGNGMRYRMERIATDNTVKLPMAGLFDKISHKPDPNAVTGTSATAADGSASIVAVNAPSILNKNSPLDPILSLLSLAAQERIRGVVEDSYALARGRQTTSDGQVPMEWEGLARDPATTDNVNNSINARLHNITSTERTAETARIEKRAQRKRKRDRELNNATAMSDANGTAVAPDGTPTANGDTPGGAAGATAPEPAKISKKELDRIKKADYANEELLTRNTNMAASMALGGGKKYSWMSGSKAKAAAPAKPAAGTSAPGTPTSSAPAGPQTAEEKAEANGLDKNGLPLAALDRKYGEWREDGELGRNIQLRDLVGVLEMDGRDRKALSWALLRLGRERWSE